MINSFFDTCSIFIRDSAISKRTETEIPMLFLCVLSYRLYSFSRVNRCGLWIGDKIMIFSLTPTSRSIRLFVVKKSRPTPLTLYMQPNICSYIFDFTVQMSIDIFKWWKKIKFFSFFFVTLRKLKSLFATRHQSQIFQFNAHYY